MTTSSVLHENENYVVEVRDGQYSLINRHTEVVEATSNVLPHMISEAEQYNSYLLYSSWKWIKKAAERETIDAEAQLGAAGTPVGLPN